MNKHLSSALLFGLLGSSVLTGCDDLFSGFGSDGDGEGSIGFTTETTDMVAAGGVVTLHADFWISEGGDDVSMSYAVNGEWKGLPTAYGVHDDGSEYLVLEIDTSELSNGEHEFEVLLSVDGTEYSDSLTIEFVDGVVLERIQAGSLGWDGEYGGGPEPELHVFDADGSWLACAAAYEDVAFRSGGAPILRSDLEGRSVYVMLTENDDESFCAPPAFTSDLFGDADDFLGQSAVFTMEEGATIDFDGTSISIGFGRGW